MFSSFLSLVSLEFKIALRYLFIRSKEEGFISLISLFSFLGIFLGVSTLIIVMSVMNGFREKLISGILGVSGHIKISSAPRFAGHLNYPTKDLGKTDRSGC
jgi:lipoprotein-releasing system permease protein